ncbi:hypothetical protein [Metabacillus sp. Hm71]|uniref:hypothetical protein n=1 Tax=Metabacillus sp. Hm71 TaxID=3450743 RepID=UPI003F423709
MIQKEVLIGDVVVPIIEEGGDKYYPISYVTQKLLLRQKGGLVTKSVKDKYRDSIKEFEVDFKSGSKQLCNCIEEEVLKELLSKTQTRRLSLEKRIQQNKLHIHLGIESLKLKESTIDEMTAHFLNEHDEYTKEIIQHEIETSKDLKFQLCSKCNKYHPLTNTFYNPDSRKNNGYNESCNICIGRTNIFRHFDKDKFNAMQKSKDYYEAINERDLFKVYEHYLKGHIEELPGCFQNKSDYFRIICYLYENGKVNKNNLTGDLLTKEFKLYGLYRFYKLIDIYSFLFSDCHFFPWNYPLFPYTEVNYSVEDAVIIFKNYIEENKVVIDDPIKFDYASLFKEMKILSKVKYKLLEIIVNINNKKYAGYLFDYDLSTYYKYSQNILFDLKYVIEVDLKIPISKIPERSTKNKIAKKANRLFNIITVHGYKSFYRWINKIYPNMLNINDFKEGYEIEFDSEKEAVIHNILIGEFDNVKYNERNANDTIKIGRYVPDWFVYTDKGTWVVEYFGLYDERRTNSDRVIKYINKTKKKIDEYKNHDEYKFIYLYPSDIEEDFLGCREKLKVIE